MPNRSLPSAGWVVVLTGAAALLSACGGGDSPDHALRTRFPAQAAQILEGAASPAPDDGGYRLNAITTTDATATEEARRAPGITARFPRNGAQPVRFDLPSGASFHVREHGVHGPAEATGAAIAYARDGGTAFWTRTASGYEEWLLLEAGIACPGAEVAAWEVEGGSLRQRGDAIEVIDAEGQAQIRVTAPKAFAAGGREVPVRISAGGQRIAIEVDAGCEAALVDPAWELVKPMLAERYEHATVRLGDAANEIVLVIGGTLSNGLVTDGVEAYDPKTDIWSLRTSLVNGRARHTATVLKNGKVLVAGGIAGGPVPWVEIYNPVINVWEGTPSMSVGRHSHAAALLNDGRVLVAGGIGVGGSPLKSAEIYDPTTNTWSTIAPMWTFRFLHTATTLLDGRVLLWGADGVAGFPTLNTPFDLYDPATGTWAAGDFLETTRQRHTATLLPNGNVLIAGGEIKGQPLGSVQIFEPMGNLRSSTTPLLTPRSMHTATLLPNGNVLVVGGYTPNGAGVSPTATTEIFYPSNVRWSYSAALNDARDSHTATLLSDTRVMVAGGKSGLVAIESAEVYGSALGDSCQTVKDCPSGHCVDGTCCDAACDLGQCDACSTKDGAAKNGHCEILMGAFCDDGQACTADDACDASGVCLSGPVIPCTPSGECLESACDFGLGACVETPTDDGAYCSVGSCKAGVCVEPPGTGGAGGSGGAGGNGGAGGSGGAPAALDEIYVQGGCICGVPGRSAPSSKPSWTLGLLTAALGMLAARRALGRRAQASRPPSRRAAGLEPTR